MNFYYWIALFIGSLGILSCGEKVDEVTKLKVEVIRVHDEGMPKMGELRSFQKLLLAEADQFQKTSADSIQIQRLKLAAKACDNAYEGMFVWMRQFDSQLEGMDDEKSMMYLQDQLIKVSEVNREIKRALNDAAMLMEKR